MNFLHNDLGYLNCGELIEVRLDHAATIRRLVELGLKVKK
jgi:hypothetical protein